MPNLSMGEYDMVLALSESKINFELRKLMKREVIKSKWQFLTSTSGEYLLHESDPSFENTKKTWLGKNNNSADQSVLVKKYQLLMDAVIDAPSLALIPGNFQEVLFKLTIKSGSIYYREDGEVQKFDLAGTIYAFLVPIDKIRIDRQKMYFAGQDALNQLRTEGLNDHDFTVDSILLNFEHAKISKYSAAESKLPKQDNEKSKLQIAITNYFKALGNDEKNPYVLGYALNKKQLSHRDIPMLYATGTSFSTSPNANSKASAFNFLMLTDHHPFPEGPLAGRIENTLIDNTEDPSAVFNGLIAIDYQAFERGYLNSLHEVIVDNFEKAFRSNKDLNEFYRSNDFRGPGCTAFIFKRGGTYMQMLLERRAVVEHDGIVIVYIITVWGTVHAEIPRKVFHFISAGTVGVDQGFSTSGTYPIDGKSGCEGKLLVKLKASNEGKLDVKAKYIPPLIGRDTEKPQTRDNIDAIWMVLSNFISPFGLIGGLIAFLTDDADKSIVTFKDEVFDDIKFTSLEGFAGRVVLPGSNIYTFKNIRLKGNPYSGDCSVNFDISYILAAE